MVDLWHARALFAFVALLATAAIFALTGKGASAKSLPTLTIGASTAPAGFDPSKLEPDPYDEDDLPLMYAPLIHQNPDGSLSPGLAMSWHFVGSGNKAFELTLRHDARFSNGKPVTAADVKAWLQYFPKAKYSLAGDLGTVTSITTSGKWSVTIHVASGNPLIGTILSEAFNWGYVASPQAIANPSLFAKGGQGAGPYVLVPSQTVAGDHYTFVPNKYYYDPSAIHYSKIVIRVITSPASMLAALQTHQVDAAMGDPTTAKAAANAGFKVIHQPTQTLGFIFTNMGSGSPLANVKVRQALNYAINRSAIARALGGAYATATSEYLTPDGFDPKYQHYYPYDPSKAKALLAAAGYPNGFTFTLLSSTFTGSLGDPISQAVAQELSAVGVTAKITSEPSGSAFGSAIGSGTYDSFELLYGGDPMSVQYGFYWAPKAPFNQHGFDDPFLDQLEKQALGARPKKAAALWVRMSQRTVARAEMLPIFETDAIWYTKSVRGIAFSDHADSAYPTEWSSK